MRGRRTEDSIVNLATGAILFVAIPALGVLIAWPLWYLGTNHPAVYSALVAVVFVGLAVRGVQRRR